MANNLLNGIMVGISIGFIISLFLWILPMRDKIQNLERSKIYVDSTYLHKQGSTSTYGGGELGKDFINYDLRSWDGGKNWYAVDYNFDKKELKVLGEADSIYPNLLKHLDAWDKLTEQAKKKGGLNPNNKEDVEILEEAGFTVKKKKDE